MGRPVPPRETKVLTTSCASDIRGGAAEGVGGTRRILSGQAKRIVGIVVGVAVVCVAIGLYIGLYLVNVPGSSAASPRAAGVQLNLATVAASELGDRHPTWVSYYVVDAKDQNWQHKTTFDLPAHTLVHVKVLQFDGQ